MIYNRNDPRWTPKQYDWWLRLSKTCHDFEPWEFSEETGKIIRGKITGTSGNNGQRFINQFSKPLKYYKKISSKYRKNRG